MEPGPTGSTRPGGRAVDFSLGPPTLTASISPSDPILDVWEDLNPSSKRISISRGWQHFKGRFLVTVKFDLILAVH